MAARFQPGNVEAPGAQWPTATLAVRVRGFADLHNHIFAYLGFGGMAFHGRAFGPIEQALPWCNHAHGPGGTGDILGNFVCAGVYGTGVSSGLGHSVGGHPQFDGWPRWDSITHQSVCEDWLKRAVDGGLRLMVALAVNNEKFCEMANKAPGRTCNDIKAVDKQLDEAWAMQAYIDAKAGGTGKGWFRIVTSPAEARRVMDQGKLAVVLGVEVDNPLGCGYVRKPKCFAKVGVPPTECVYPNPAEIPLACNPATVTQRLDAWYRKGVRHLFPVHFADNAFAGTAKQNGLQWLVDRQAGDDWWGVAWVPAVPPSILPVEEYAIQVASCEASSGHASYGGKCNVRGLSGLGQHLVVQMMRRGMIIDIDHMGSRAKAAVFQLAKQYGYPGLVSGHSGFIATSLGDHRHEGQLSDAELKQLRAIGGLVGLILHQGKSVHDAPTWTGGNVRIPHRCGNSIETFAQAYLYATQSGDPVAFGTDYNGMIPPFGPRLGPERCRGGENASQPVNVRSTQPMPYPFVARGTGLTMNKSTAGNRTFDIATDGPAHIGMLPDLINDLEWIGVPPDRLEPLFNSAEAYVQLWERSEAVGRTIP